jgi:c-di-GMP-related signal transduction protein
VTLTMLGGLTPGSRDDLVTVLARASCCESVAARTGGDGAKAATAYLLGMLSGIAQIMHTDITQVAEGAGLDPQLVTELRGGTGPLGAIVGAVVDHETGRPFTTALPDLSEGDVSLAYLQSWGNALARVSDILDH